MKACAISRSVARQIADHAAGEAPREVCGLLAGRGSRVTAAYPLRNVAAKPETRFQADPLEQLQALKAIDEAKLAWIGAYHSHPRSEPIPSERDIEDCVDSGLPQLIVSLAYSKPRLKLWRIEGDAVTPIELVYDTQPPPEVEAALSPGQQAALLMVAIAAVLILLIIAVTLLPPAPELATAR